MEFDQAIRSVVALQSSIPEDGFTASVLGTERAGSGVVIRDDGLVLTIGYLITEAESVWLTGADGKIMPAHPLAYDAETGFGLVQPLGRLDLPAIGLGDSNRARIGDNGMLASGGRTRMVETRIVAKQEFAGYWEYLLDEAIFTAPAHRHWGGAALIGADGKLLGIGSLLLQMATDGSTEEINMVVPIKLLAPIFDDLVRYGHVNKPPRPWLGVYSAEGDGRVVVLDVDGRGPAAAAGMRQGDVIAEVGNHEVVGLADLYRTVWESGPAGTEIPLRVVRDERELWLRIRSANRSSLLKKPLLQ